MLQWCMIFNVGVVMVNSDIRSVFVKKKKCLVYKNTTVWYSIKMGMH